MNFSSPAIKSEQNTVLVGEDGSSIEAAKRTRGRPPGSKNKPKPPVILTRDSDASSSSFKTHMLEIADGGDVIRSLQSFSRQKKTGLCVLAANGAVSNLTLRLPPHPTPSATASTAGTVSFNGRFNILSMSATIMPPGVTAAAAAHSPSAAITVAAAAAQSPSAAITEAAASAQILGGTVVGPLMAAGPVTIVALAFKNVSFTRLPAVLEQACENEIAMSGSITGSGKDQKEDRQGRFIMPQESHFSAAPHQLSFS